MQIKHTWQASPRLPHAKIALPPRQVPSGSQQPSQFHEPQGPLPAS